MGMNVRPTWRAKQSVPTNVLHPTVLMINKVMDMLLMLLKPQGDDARRRDRSSSRARVRKRRSKRRGGLRQPKVVTESAR